MGVVRKQIQPLNSTNNGTLTSNLSSLRHRGSANSSYSREGDGREQLSVLSSKEREEVSEIVNTIKGYLHNPPTDQESASKSSKICKVPNNLREIHEHDFDPKLVSIGPLHYRRGRHFEIMEEHKKRFLLCLLNSSTDQLLEPESSSTTENPYQTVTIFDSESLSTRSFNRHNSSTAEPVLGQGKCDQASTTIDNKIENLVIEMKKLETKARDFYSERFNEFGSNEFVMMMILDGCFVVELLRLYDAKETDGSNLYDQEDITCDDPIFNTRWMLPKLQRDLLLFENQLPFFLLEKLFNITNSNPKTTVFSLVQLTIKFFDPLLPRDPDMLIEQKCRINSKNYDHLLDIFHSSFFPCISIERISPSQYSSFHSRIMNISGSIPPAFAKQPLIHCVTELREAGVLFRSREKHNLLDIEFKDGKLYIPPLLIDDHTCPVFLNFVAYEQCNQNSKPYFTHYLLFFDSLVNSSKDVEHLHYKGIIGHVLGSDEDVANLFNKLCKEVVHDLHDCYLAEQLKNVNQYFYMKVHKWWATWKYDHFRNPWAFSSLLAAMSLLFLTTIQSFFTVLAYFLPPSNLNLN